MQVLAPKDKKKRSISCSFLAGSTVHISANSSPTMHSPSLSSRLGFQLSTETGPLRDPLNIMKMSGISVEHQPCRVPVHPNKRGFLSSWDGGLSLRPPPSRLKEDQLKVHRRQVTFMLPLPQGREHRIPPETSAVILPSTPLEGGGSERGSRLNQDWRQPASLARHMRLSCWAKLAAG